MNFTYFFGIIFILCSIVLNGNCRPLNIIKDLLRNNVAGPAVNFQTVSWPVDPDAGLRRRTEYEAINGRYGYKHVERIGLGEDGRTEERRLQQRLRDEVGAAISNSNRILTALGTSFGHYGGDELSSRAVSF